jgi:GntR family transcriptional regulator
LPDSRSGASRAGQLPLGSTNALQRSSPVPLYYQLQELLKQEIEAGTWAAGTQLPSEPDLAHFFAVNRTVVRQALEMLEGDGQVSRQRGRGTFVSEPKIDHRASGLTTILLQGPHAPTRVDVLDSQRTTARGAVGQNLKTADDEPILCLTTRLSVRGVPVAVGRSYFRWSESDWIRELARPGNELPGEFATPEHFPDLSRSDVAVQSTTADKFEASQLGVPEGSTVFLVLCTEVIHDGADERTFEVARFVYRSDIVQFQLTVSPTAGNVSAVLGLGAP